MKNNFNYNQLVTLIRKYYLHQVMSRGIKIKDEKQILVCFEECDFKQFFTRRAAMIYIEQYNNCDYTLIDMLKEKDIKNIIKNAYLDARKIKFYKGIDIMHGPVINTIISTTFETTHAVPIPQFDLKKEKAKQKGLIKG